MQLYTANTTLVNIHIQREVCFAPGSFEFDNLENELIYAELVLSTHCISRMLNTIPKTDLVLK